MNKDEIVSVTTPWWDTPHEGKITKKFKTPIENFYVIEFPDGEVITMKESEIRREYKNIKWVDFIDKYMGICPQDWHRDFCEGFVAGLWYADKLDYADYRYLISYVESKAEEKI